MLTSTNKKILVPLFALLFLGVGMAASFFLVRTNQDIRQQAYTQPSGSAPDDKGITDTSYDGERAKTERGCGGVWMNSYCYMPGDKLAGGYVVVDSGRYDFPYIEKQEIYESVNFGAETYTNKVGTTSSLGDNCGGKGLAVSKNCYAYGSTVNGYLVMPPRADDCDNKSGDYCYAHLKKIETDYDAWKNAVDRYMDTGSAAGLEKLYRDTYGVGFDPGEMFDPKAANADTLRAQALISALTDVEAFRQSAIEENQALERKGKLTDAEQNLYDFNKKIINDKNLGIRYQLLDQLTESTAQQTTFKRQVNKMYQDLVKADEKDLGKLTTKKFKELYGYDPLEKYGDVDKALTALGIDPHQLEKDRDTYADELAKQEAQKKQQAAQAGDDKERDLLTDYVEDSRDKDTLEDLYELYTGKKPSSNLSQDDLLKTVSEYSSQVALQAYLDTGNVDFLRENYMATRGVRYAPSDEEDLLRALYGNTVGSQIYKDAVLPTLVSDAISNFAQNPQQLESVCSSALGSACNLNSQNATRKLGELLDTVYGGSGSNVEEMTVSVANQLFADAEEAARDTAKKAMLVSQGALRTADYGQAEASAERAAAIETANLFNTQNVFAYANQSTVRSNLSDYTWGTTLGNATMYDNVFNRTYNLQDDFGLSGLDAVSMTWNQIETQAFNVTNNVENIATNYAVARQSGYTGPVNTNVADLALQAAENMGVLDYDYQAAADYHYLKQSASNVAATVADWSVTASTYASLALANSTPTAYAAAADVAKIDYANIVDTAVAAGERTATRVREKTAENLVKKQNEQAQTKAEQVDLDQYIAFQTDKEIVRSRQELNWETVEKVVAPAAAVVILPAAVASGAGLGVIAGAASSTFSLYQGAGQKAQALELERVVISDNETNRRNAAALSLAESGEVTYDEALNQVEQQAAMLSKQSNIMLASSAVAGLTSGAGIIQGFTSGGSAALSSAPAVGRAVAATNSLANTSAIQAVGQGMAMTGRIGGLSLGAYTAINSGQEAAAAAHALENLEEELSLEVANGNLTQQEADSLKADRQSDLWGQLALSGASSFIAASGIVGNSFGFVQNPTIGMTKTDLVLDLMNVPVGVAVDAQNVSQTCFNPNSAASESDCRKAWVGLALSLTQDIAQSRTSITNYKNSQFDQINTQVRTEDLAQRIAATDQRILDLMEQNNRSIGDSLDLLDLKAHRQGLVDEALTLNPDLVIAAAPLTKMAVDAVDTDKLVDTAIKNYDNLRKSADDAQSKGDAELASKLRLQAEDKLTHQSEIIKLSDEIAAIDQQVKQRSDQMSQLEIEAQRSDRQNKVDQLDKLVGDQGYKAANLDQDNQLLLAAARNNEAFKTYDENQQAVQDQADGLRRLNLPPPDENDSTQKRTGLASLLPGVAEQNKALDLSELQTKLLEASDLQTQKTQIKQDLTKNPNDDLSRQLQAELEDVEQKLTAANQEIERLTPTADSTDDNSSIVKKLTSLLPGQKTAQEYDQAMQAMVKMNALSDEMTRVSQELETISQKSRLSNDDISRMDELEVEMNEITAQHQAAQKLVEDITPKVQRALVDQEQSLVASLLQRSAAGLSKLTAGIGGAGKVLDLDAQKTFDQSYRNAQMQEEAKAIKSQLSTVKNDYDQLNRNQSQLEKINQRLEKLDQERVTLETKTSRTAEQDQRLKQLQAEVDNARQEIETLTNAVTRMEEKLLQPVLAAEVSRQLVEAQKQGDLDTALETVRNEELVRIESELDLTARQRSLVDDLLASRARIFATDDPQELLAQRQTYNQKLSELNQDILGDAPTQADYQKLSQTQLALKSLSAIEAAEANRSSGDEMGAIEVLSSKEASLPLEDPQLKAQLETIIRDVEFRSGVSDNVAFFNTRTNQMDTFLKIFEGERVAIELTTAGGKTFVGAAALKAQTELLGYQTGVYIAKPGQEADIQRSLSKAYGVDQDKILVLDSSRLSEADYVDSLLAGQIVVSDPSNLQFIRNSANNYQDPNFGNANQVYQKLTQNTAQYIDELQINLDPSRQAINSVGASTQKISQEQTDTARVVGDVLGETLLRNGGWGLGDNDFLVLKTSEGAEIAKFSSDAQDQIFANLANRMGVSGDDYDLVKNNALEVETAFNQGQRALTEKLGSLGTKVSPAEAEKILDQIDMVNTFAQGLKMQKGTDYQRMVDQVMVKNGGPNREVTVPASGAVANEGQSYNAKLQAAMEYIGAKAYGQNPDFNGLTASPNLAYKSTIADYLGDLRDSAVGAVTGALADGRGVVETALGLVTYRSTEAVDKILGIEGSTTGERISVDRSYQVSRDNDVDALVALKQTGQLNQSAGEDSRGNLKVVLGFDGAKNPLDFATEMARSGAFKEASYAVQKSDGSYEVVKISESGEVTSSRGVTTKEIQDLYKTGTENLVTIIGRGGATGDSITTDKSVPGVTVTSLDTPEGLVAQAGARIDRGSDIADQHALIINRDLARVDTSDAAEYLTTTKMSEADFADFRNRVTEVQTTVEQAKNTQALDQGVTAASTRVLSDLIRNSADTRVQRWASEKLLDFYTDSSYRDLYLTGGAQESLTARQKKISAQQAKWLAVIGSPSNARALELIKQKSPEAYTQMERNAQVDSQRLGYAPGAAEEGKEAVMTAGNLDDFVSKHNQYVTADSESKYVADSGRQPVVNQVATGNQINTRVANLAQGAISKTVETVKGLRNISLSLPSLKGINLAGRVDLGNLTQNLGKLPTYIKTWVSDAKTTQENQRQVYQNHLDRLTELNDKLTTTTDLDEKANITAQIQEVDAEMSQVSSLAIASATMANFMEDIMEPGISAVRVWVAKNLKTSPTDVQEQREQVIANLGITDETLRADVSRMVTTQELDNFVTARQAAYLLLRDQFSSLNTTRPRVENEAEYQTQSSKLEQLVAEIETLQQESGLIFAETDGAGHLIRNEDGTYTRLNQDDFGTLSEFRRQAESAIAQVEAERLAAQAARQQAETEAGQEEELEEEALNEEPGEQASETTFAVEEYDQGQIVVVDATSDETASLNRVVQQNIETGKPILIEIESYYFEYQHQSEHTTFGEGIELKGVEGVPSSEVFRRVLGVIQDFSLSEAIEIAGYEKLDDGSLAKSESDEAVTEDILEVGDEESAPDPAIVRAANRIELFVSNWESLDKSSVLVLPINSIRENSQRIARVIEFIEAQQLDKNLIKRLKPIANALAKSETDYKNLSAQIKRLIKDLGLKNAKLATNLRDLRNQKINLEDQIRQQQDQQTPPMVLEDNQIGQPFMRSNYRWSRIGRGDAMHFKSLINRQPAAVRELFTASENGIYHPKYVANIGGRKAYFTGPIQRQGQKRKYMAFYLEGNDGKLYPRILYKSQSQGAWRTTPGYDVESNNYNKGYNKNLYTVETQLSPPFADLVEQIEVENSIKYVSYGPIREHFNMAELFASGVRTYDREIPREIRLSTEITAYRPGRLREKYLSAEQIVNMERNISAMTSMVSFMPDFSQDPVMVRHNYHHLLGEITYETYQIYINIGDEQRPLNWEMATTPDGRVWINNIYLADAKLTTYGNLREVINSGILTSKPVDYTKQVTAVPNHLKQKIPGTNYHDISSFVDLLLPVREYRSARNFYPNTAGSSFNNLCSSCAEVRDQTRAGLEVVEQLLASNDEQAALAQISQVRTEVVNSHGMQNQCVQLYLNAWVDTKEAEIRNTLISTYIAVDSVHRATIMAEKLLDSTEMKIIERKGFLGIGRKTSKISLTTTDKAAITTMLNGDESTMGLREMADFKRDKNGKVRSGIIMTKDVVVGGILSEHQNMHSILGVNVLDMLSYFAAFIYGVVETLHARPFERYGDVRSSTGVMKLFDQHIGDGTLLAIGFIFSDILVIVANNILIKLGLVTRKMNPTIRFLTSVAIGIAFAGWLESLPETPFWSNTVDPLDSFGIALAAAWILSWQIIASRTVWKNKLRKVLIKITEKMFKKRTGNPIT